MRTGSRNQVRRAAPWTSRSPMLLPARRAAFVALLAVLLLGTLLPTGAAAPAAGQWEKVAAEPTAGLVPARIGAVPKVRWRQCAEKVLEDVPEAQRELFRCAYYRVPLDHDNEALGSTDIAMIKRAATDQARRIGSLFVNPGGPGGAGIGFTTRIDDFLSPRVLARFDIVGFDPRGVGASNPLQCFDTKQDANAVQRPLDRFSVPVSRKEISSVVAAYREYGQFCGRNAGPMLSHISTRDVVRDLDMMRAAVGDNALNYAGFSYGTLIGATYANMFPSASRALVLDGNVDPTLRTSDGNQYDRERARGFEIALDGFLAECKQVGPKCAFSTGVPRQKYEQIRQRLRAEPVTLPDGETLTYSEFVGNLGGNLYDAPEFRAIGRDLQTIYQVISAPSGARLGALPPLQALDRTPVDPMRDIVPDSPYTDDDALYGVNCSDKPFQRGNDTVPAMAAEWEQESPTFGRSQAFSDPAACPVWPRTEADPYTGPWDTETPNPVVVVGNYFDPATQYAFSERMADQLGNARLVTADAFGHCILGDSAGVDTVVSDYLINLKTPAPGQVFDPDTQPFDFPDEPGREG